MPFISMTRLRLRSLRFFPAFLRHAASTQRQIAAAPGFQAGALLMDGAYTFWTLSAWDSQDAMRAYMTSGAHRVAMPLLLHWCDEASVGHWLQAEAALPGWAEVDRRMREEGRPSKVHHPSRHHLSMTFRRPWRVLTGPIAPDRPRGSQ